MRKGDTMRQRILDAAETLFYQKGYANTTVDMLLMALSLSKGGFYHYFASKEALLDALCQRQAEACAAAIQASVDACPGSACEKLNAMFDKNGLWQGASPDFICLLIRVGYRDDNLLLREGLKRRVIALCLPLIDAIVGEGAESGLFRTPYPEGVGHLILQLGGSLCDEIAYRLAGEEEPDLVQVLSLIEVYRFAMEQTLVAPQGSIRLYQLRSFAELCENIHAKTLA